MNAATLFDLIDRLIESLPMSPESVAGVLEVRLSPQPEASTAAMSTHALAGGDARFSSVGLRVPDEDVGGSGGLLKLVLADTTGAPDRAALIARFGGDFEVKAPSPRFKPGSVPVYLSYRQEWGQLSFALDAGNGDRVTGVVLEESPPV